MQAGGKSLLAILRNHLIEIKMIVYNIINRSNDTSGTLQL